MQIIAIKIAKNRGRDFPEGQLLINFDVSLIPFDRFQLHRKVFIFCQWLFNDKSGTIAVYSISATMYFE